VRRHVAHERSHGPHVVRHDLVVESGGASEAFETTSNLSAGKPDAFAASHDDTALIGQQ
jgi:hypothetical protein